MTMPSLRKDMAESAVKLETLGAMSSLEEVVAFLKDTLWPTLEALSEETEQIDGCVEDLLNGSEDILQPETAQVFAAMVVSGRVIAGELRKRLRPEESALRSTLDEFERMATEATAALEEITIPDDDDADHDDVGVGEAKPA